MLGVLRWVVIAVLVVVTAAALLLHAAAVGAADRGGLLQTPGGSVAGWPSGPVDTYREVLRPADDGGQGFLAFLRNSAGRRRCDRGADAAGGDPRRVRGQPAAVLRPPAGRTLFLAVYLFPSILLAIPLFVLFTRLGLRGSLVGLTIVYIAQTVPVSIYMLRNYFETIPVSLEEAAAVDGAAALRRSCGGQPAAGHAGGHGERAVRLHDRLERVPVRAAVPGRGPAATGRCRSGWRSSPAASRSPRPC